MSLEREDRTIEVEFDGKYFDVDLTIYTEDDTFTDVYDPGTKGSSWVEVNSVTCYNEEGEKVECSDDDYQKAADMAAANAY